MLIVGAGLSGLIVARRLADAGVATPILLEKSRGVGGRLATRRTERAKFDHGAQFYSLHESLRPCHERWERAGLVASWFEAGEVKRYRALGGMTALAKNLAEGLDVKLSEEAFRIRRATDGWEVETKAGTRFSAPRLLLTCPLPQSLALLERSELSFDPALRKVAYAKALVLLLEDVRAEIALPHGYLEKPTPEIQSIADQRAKGLSPLPAWTVTMSPEFSESLFEGDEELSLAKCLQALSALAPGLTYEAAQLKKWRYSHPLAKAGERFVEVHAGLYLAGDAFGRPSLNGAATSGEALARELISSGVGSGP